jgi:hypothetical protein
MSDYNFTPSFYPIVPYEFLEDREEIIMWLLYINPELMRSHASPSQLLAVSAEETQYGQLLVPLCCAEVTTRRPINHNFLQITQVCQGS